MMEHDHESEHYGSHLLPQVELEECEFDFLFTTILMLDELCVCTAPDLVAQLIRLAYWHTAVCLFGVVVLLLCLVVTSTMITKSSTAVLVSILLLYKLLRLSAVGLLASFTPIAWRDLAQRVSNALWMISMWGVNYTLLDLSVEQLLEAFRPKLAQVYATPLKALKRTVLVMVVGLVFSSNALTQAVVKTRLPGMHDFPVTCDDRNFFFAYWKWYQKFLVTAFWVVPLSTLTICFLVLLGHVLQRRVLQKHLHYQGSYRSHSAAKEFLDEQLCSLCLVGWNLALNLPLAYQLLLTAIWNFKISSVRFTELCVVVATVTAPFSLLLWQRFRQEGFKSFAKPKQQAPPIAINRSISMATSWG